MAINSITYCQVNDHVLLGLGEDAYRKGLGICQYIISFLLEIPLLSDSPLTYHLCLHNMRFHKWRDFNDSVKRCPFRIISEQKLFF